MTLSLHTTPGTTAAFDFQFERALYWLAQSPAGSVIGIETDDDVATDTTENHREPLAGSDTEQISGTYHRLADLIRVGWHPRFEELMKKFIRSH